MSNEQPQTLGELGAAFLERLRAEHAAALARAEQLAAAIEAAERIVPELVSTVIVPTATAVADASVPQVTAQLGDSDYQTPPFGRIPGSQSVSLQRNPSWSRRLQGMTQQQALIAIAKQNNGIVKVAEARDILIESGLSGSKPRVLYGAIHSRLRKSDEFEQLNGGAFRLKSAPEQTTEQNAEQAVIANGWTRISPDNH